MKQKETTTRGDPDKTKGLQKVGDVIRELYPHLKLKINEDNFFTEKQLD